MKTLNQPTKPIKPKVRTVETMAEYRKAIVNYYSRVNNNSIVW